MAWAFGDAPCAAGGLRRSCPFLWGEFLAKAGRVLILDGEPSALLKCGALKLQTKDLDPPRSVSGIAILL